MPRIALTCAVSLLLVACAAPGPAHPNELPPGAEAPSVNFVFVLADDLGWRDLGCYGSTFYETPNLDRLASTGVLFTQGYAACPVCSPTRASIMAGKYPARMQTTDWFGGRRVGRMLPAPYRDRLALEEVTLAEALQQAGYRTAFFGKWHLGPAGFFPEDQGFQHNVGGHRRGSPPAGYFFFPYENPKLADGPDGEHLTDRLTDEAIGFLESNSRRPFLLYLSYYAVHTPLQAKPELAAHYRAKKATLPSRGDSAWGRERERRVRRVQDHAVYASMVHTLDENVGRLLRRLEELGVADRTVVVFTSDNGGLSTSEGHPTSNLPLRGGKGWLYEGGVRVPYIVRWPGQAEAGGICAEPVISNDFYPTMLDMAGQPARPEQHSDGVSLVPLLRDQSPLPDRPLFWHYPHYGNQGASPAAAVRRGRYKLIEWYEEDRVELFDLLEDLGEQRDLARERPELAAELRALLRGWQLGVNAKMARPNPDAPFTHPDRQ